MNRKVTQHPKDLLVGWGDGSVAKVLAAYKGLGSDPQNQCRSGAGGAVTPELLQQDRRTRWEILEAQGPASLVRAMERQQGCYLSEGEGEE